MSAETTDWQTVKGGRQCVRCGGTKFLEVNGKPDILECEKCGTEKQATKEG